jgi:threonine/homoserine/homoserine lactone efflux protein
MDNLLALIGFAIATSATPGPNTLMISAAAARAGLRAVVPHMMGITLGFPAMLLAIAAGLGWPFQEFPWLHRGMQVVGGAWLLYLAWKIAASPPPAGGRLNPPPAGGRLNPPPAGGRLNPPPAGGQVNPPASGQETGPPAAPILGFWGAAAFQWVNPKAWLIALAAVPAFTRPDAALLPQALAMAGVFALVSLPCLLLWAGVGLGARRWLGSPARLRWFNRSMAVLLVLSLVPAML